MFVVDRTDSRLISVMENIGFIFEIRLIAVENLASVPEIGSIEQKTHSFQH